MFVTSQLTKILDFHQNVVIRSAVLMPLLQSRGIAELYCSHVHECKSMKNLLWISAVLLMYHLLEHEKSDLDISLTAVVSSARA
jgi:hypothetical protein